MIYNARNRSNDIKEIQKEKRPVLMLIFSTVRQKYGTKEDVIIRKPSYIEV